jgi:hypothetical protein
MLHFPASWNGSQRRLYLAHPAAQPLQLLLDQPRVIDIRRSILCRRRHFNLDRREGAPDADYPTGHRFCSPGWRRSTTACLDIRQLNIESGTHQVHVHLRHRPLRFTGRARKALAVVVLQLLQISAAVCSKPANSCLVFMGHGQPLFAGFKPIVRHST